MLLGEISTDLSTSTIFNRYAIEFAPKTGLQYAFVGNLYDSKIFTILTDMQLNLLLKLVYSMLCGQFVWFKNIHYFNRYAIEYA